MIELEQIKATDKLGNIRPLINTALNEIQQDQPMIGKCLNPTVNLYNGPTLTGSITATNMQKCYLSALIFPENNGCFVAGIIGHCEWAGDTEIPECTFTTLTINIPAVKAPNGTTYTSFLTPAHLELPYQSGQNGTEKYFIGFNSSLDQNAELKNPFIYACIETSINVPSTFNVALQTLTPKPVTISETTHLYLNF